MHSQKQKCGQCVGHAAIPVQNLGTKVGQKCVRSCQASQQISMPSEHAPASPANKNTLVAGLLTVLLKGKSPSPSLGSTTPALAQWEFVYRGPSVPPMKGNAQR